MVMTLPGSFVLGIPEMVEFEEDKLVFSFRSVEKTLLFPLLFTKDGVLSSGLW